MNQIIEINDIDFDKMITENSLEMPVLLKFWGNWCQPCKRMEPILENISSLYNRKIKIFSINVENNQIITNKFSIRSIPSLLFFHNGNLISKHSGFLSKDQIEKLIKSNFGI